MRFGVFADVHFCSREDDGERFFSQSKRKLEACLNRFQKAKADFVVCLGDLIDGSEDSEELKAWLEELQTVIRGSGLPFYMCPGNHDRGGLPDADLLALLPGVPAGGYGSFEAEGIHFVLLDSNYQKDGRRRTAAVKWDELYLDEQQLQWLEMDLEQTDKPAVIYVHANLDSRLLEGERDPHVVVNHRQVRAVLEKSGKVSLVLQGHCHSGALTVQRRIFYVTLKALVEGERQIPGLMVDCDPQKEEYRLEFFDGAEADDGETE